MRNCNEMDEDDQISRSPSVLIPESPESPLRIPSPTFQPWRPGLHIDQESETFTQPDPVNDNAQFNIESNEGPFTDNEEPHEGVIQEESNTGDMTEPMSNFDSNSNSAQSTSHRVPEVPRNIQVVTTDYMWRPGIIYDDPIPNLPQSSIHSEDSNSTVPLNEESNSMASLPDAHQHATDSVDEPPAKVRRISSPKGNDEMDGETCPICLDSWSNSGDHRLVALKCGHLFGSECVIRWLKAQNTKNQTCPTCKSKAAIRDIRFIYARRLVAADTSQITELQKQLELLHAQKSRTELELQKSKIAHRACVLQLEVLRNTLMKNQVTREQPKRAWRFSLEKNLEISRDGGCRVLTYNCRTYELYVSQKSANNLFPGYGIRKVSCVDYKLGQFVHLHPKPIRDITYSQPRDLLLSVGLDSTVRIVERGVPTSTVQCGIPLWSVSWDYLRSNEFYVGGVGGVIQQYDVRNQSTYIQRLNAPGDMSPVVSLCSTEYGLLSCQLNSCWIWVGSRQLEPRALPIDGPFMSLAYDNESHRALISCRPSNGRSRLTVCKLKSSSTSGEILFDAEQTFAGSARSTLMSRSAWVKAPGSAWVAAHSESDSALYLHGLDGARTMCLSASEPALDVCSAHLNGDTVLAALSESRLRLYKAVPTSS